MSKDSEECRDLLVHVHIPKCGGTSFNTILTHLYGKDCALDYGLLWSYQYDRKQFQEIVRLYPALKAVASHRFSLDLPWGEPGLALHPISFVRDPVDRIASWYFYTRFHKTLGTRSRDMSLRDYCADLISRDDDDAKMLLNGQLRFLTGEATEASLERIRTHLRDRTAWIFPVERFDEACLLLERQLPGLLPDTAYIKKNVSKRDQPIDPAIRELLAPHVRLDQGLRDACTEAMERLLAGTPVAGQLEDFQRRCQSLARSQKGLGQWWRRTRQRWAHSLRKRMAPKTSRI